MVDLYRALTIDGEQVDSHGGKGVIRDERIEQKGKRTCGHEQHQCGDCGGVGITGINGKGKMQLKRKIKNKGHDEQNNMRLN